MTGNAMTLVAIPWFVIETTGSAGKTGLVAFFTLVPAVLAGFFGGALVDRLGFRSMSVASDVASAVPVALIPLLHATLGIELWQLMALVFLGALLDGPGVTARTAMLPDLAETAAMPLERSTAIRQGIRRASGLLGAPTAGVLIVFLSAPTVLWIDAATFCLSALLIGVAVPATKRKETEERTGYLSELRDGLRFLRRDRLMLMIVTVVMFTNFLDAPIFSVYLPVYASQVLESPAALGAVVGTFGGCALASSLIYGVIGPRLPRRATFVVCFVIVGLPFFVLATLPPLWLAVIAVTVSGLAAGPLNPLLSVVLYHRTPENMRGRIFGTLAAGSYVAMPAGVLLGGFAVEWLGLGHTLWVLAVCYLLVTISLAVNRRLAEMDETS
jgi:MFS family permease